MIHPFSCSEMRIVMLYYLEGSTIVVARSERLFAVAVLRYTDPKFSSYGAEEYKPLSMDRSVCLNPLDQIIFSVLRLPSDCPG